jgi:hypothetical protein
MTQLLSRSADEAGYGVLVFGVDPAQLPGDAALASAQLGKEVDQVQVVPVLSTIPVQYVTGGKRARAAHGACRISGFSKAICRGSYN